MNSLAFSFDTVCVVVPTSDPVVQDRMVEAWNSTRYDAKGKALTERGRRYLWPLNELDDLPSDWTPPQVSCEGPDIVLQFSLPKLLYGHSARVAHDLSGVLEAWEQVLRQSLALPLVKGWRAWRLRRVDFCYNFTLSSPDAVEGALEQLSRVRYRGKLGEIKKGRRIPYWVSKRSTVKFYSKGSDMKRNSEDYPADWLQARQYDLDRVLRYEEEWRSEKIQRFCNAPSAAMTTVGLFLHRLQSWSVEQHLARVEKQFTVRGLPVSVEDLFQKIAQKRKPGPLREFVAQLMDRGVEAVKADMPRRTYFHRAGELGKLGFTPDMLESQYDSPLAKQFDIRPWVAIDNFSTEFDGEVLEPEPLSSKIRGMYATLAEREERKVFWA